ncbi:MAG: RNA polymerase sigma factor [Phototrophicaceae bacterium]
MHLWARKIRAAQRDEAMHDETVNRLLQQITDGHEDGLLALHARYANLVFSVALRVLNNSQDAEEVTQDVFLRLWDRAETYDPSRGGFVTWLLTITRRAAIDRLRVLGRRPSSDAVSIDAHSHLLDTVYADEAGQGDLRRSLLQALDTLSEERRQVILLVHYFGMTHSEIASHLGCPLGTVKSHIRLGMKQLRTVWMQEPSPGNGAGHTEDSS